MAAACSRRRRRGAIGMAMRTHAASCSRADESTEATAARDRRRVQHGRRLAPLPALARTARDASAWLIVDDAHGLGVVGTHGPRQSASISS